MDVNGNYDAGRTVVGVPPVSNSSRAVPVLHTGVDPTGVLSAPSTAVAIGTGTQAGKAWTKATTHAGASDWTQVLP